MKRIKLSRYLTPVFETPSNSGSWFGYYNYDTLSPDQTRMLSNRTINDARKVEKGMIIELGYYDIPSGKWHHIGESDSYNWQQGAMMQWLPGEGNENKVVFNTSDGIHNIAKIVDVSTHEEKVVDWSIYGITPDGKKSITLNFERSHWCRAYHYESVSNPDYDVQVANDDGVFEIDLENNTRKRIISIQDVIMIDYEDYFATAKHWLEHIMISPSGKRFCFLHRFTIGSLDDYETRLFIADIDGSNLQIITGWRDYYWSHFGWNGDDSFAIYTCENRIHSKIVNDGLIGALSRPSDNSTPGIMGDVKKMMVSLIPYSLKGILRKKLLGQNCGYQYYERVGSVFTLKRFLNSSNLNIDGHPSFTKDGRYLITDSYPDEKQYQRLIVFNLQSGKSIILGRIFAGLYQQNGSCDLHPKLCKNNNYLVVDSAFDGTHHMILFNLNWSLITNKLM